MKSTVLARIALAAAAVVLTGACTSASQSAARYSGPPVVDQAGQYIQHYTGPELEALLDYKYAAKNLGDEWLIVSVSFTGTQAAATEVHRDGISVRTPDGRRVFLPSQRDFIEAYSEIQSSSRRAALASQPLAFTGADRRRYNLSFLPLPGTAVARESVHTNLRNLYGGFLYFPIPGGVQPGTWKLMIDLEEAQVEIPFTLEQ